METFTVQAVYKKGKTRRERKDKLEGRQFNSHPTQQGRTAKQEGSRHL
jgi:hypothetical protein